MRIVTPDLDDVEELISADVDGLLHSVAMAGAQVRAVSEALREGVLDPLADLLPRSVILVTGTSRAAAAAADLAIATVSSRVDVPLVSTPVLPGWIGPLDVVVILGDDAGDMALADAAARALRRRAELVVGVPIEGPVREAVGSAGINLSARLDVDPRFRFSGHLAVVVATLTALTRVRFTGPHPALDEIADALDAEAAANHVSSESFHNRAKLLAERLAERPAVFCGDTAAGCVVAARATQSLVSISGIISSATDFVSAATMPRPSGNGDGPAADSIFYDPEIDGPAVVAPRIVVISVPRREWYIRQRIAGLDGAELISGAEHESGDGGREDAGPPPSPGDLAGDSPADLATHLLHLLRIEMAAVYLRLIRN